MRKKSEVRRQAIVDMAAVTFRELGYENTSMSEIAARLGSSKATLYSYFSSKEEIFAQVLTQQISGELQAAASLHYSDNDGEGDLRAILHRMGNDYLEVMLRPDVIAVRRLVNYHAERSNLGCIIYEQGPRMGWQPTADLLQARILKGELRQADAWLMAMQLRALLETEWLEKRLLGVVSEVSAAAREAAVSTAIDTFLAAYARNN